MSTPQLNSTFMNAMDTSTSDMEGLNSTGSGSGSGTNDTMPEQRQLWISPVPDWGTAIPIWGAAWPFHIYFFGAAFTILTVVTVFLLVGAVAGRKMRHNRLSGKLRGVRRGGKSLLPPPVFSLLAFASFLRALCLFADPYHSTKAFPTALSRVFGTLPFTSYLCAYQLLFLALHSALRIEVGSLRWLAKRWLIFGVAIFFMLFNTAVDLILVLAAKFRSLLVICMAANCLWMLVILAEFAINAVRLRGRIAETEATLGRGKPSFTMTAIANSGLTAAAATSPKVTVRKSFRGSMRKLRRRLTSSALFQSKSAKVEKKLSLQKAILRMTVLLLVTIVIYFAFLFYHLLGVAGAISFDGLIKPWNWYAVVTCYRSVEIFLTCAILMTLTQSQRRKRTPSDTTDSTWGASWQNSRNASQSNGGGLKVELPSTIPEEDSVASSESCGDLPPALYYFRKTAMLVTSL